MDHQEFRRLGHAFIDWLADYHASLDQRPVMSRAKPGEIKYALPAKPPLAPESLPAVLDDLDKIIVPGLSLWQHPRFFGFFPSNVELESVLGDLLSTGLGVLGLSWQSSPALTELEEVTVDWMRQALGFSPNFKGVIQDCASTSTLVALLCARERASNFSLQQGGLQGQPRPLTVYATAQAHSSVEKAGLLAGFGRANLRVIEVDGQFAMRPEHLRQTIEKDLASGQQPCAIVATFGTTAATAIDPLLNIAAIAKQYQLWLHVDAALGGAAFLLPEYRPLAQGIEDADSIVINAHKWIGAAFDCSLYFVRDAEHLIRVMSTNPSYLQSSADGQVINYRDWGLPLGRRFRALKLWLLLRGQGLTQIQTRLRRDLENAKWLATQVQATPGWRVLNKVQLQTICLRHEPAGLTGEALDEHTCDWVKRINESGEAYLSPAILDGKWMVRVSIGALRTERADVQRLWRLMREQAEK